jgi:hypothetical protein
LSDVAIEFQEIRNLRSICLICFIDEWLAKTESITPFSKKFYFRGRRDKIHLKDNRFYFFREYLGEKTLMLNSNLELAHIGKRCVGSKLSNYSHLIYSDLGIVECIYLKHTLFLTLGNNE